ncbi:hypothetical protein HH214_12795 [Mucilaginibacter robiniae]|uniref:Uncharacterized protein n=1 Tax=Mucilaginibacter robiniae TaxID=2728022 RepID=A0A7L5E2A3_9SPHI|nr:hypothetical protein [Mucilaginibacter robiniae]QJD96688.1 hypothetical protein HH214_12795 [Mucilaginibacter robiniae]
MSTLLTPILLNFLITQGYSFCLSKTQCVEAHDFETLITLKPVKYRPATRHLPLGFDTYFSLNQEPRQMAEGLMDTLVMVDIHPLELRDYIGYFRNNIN